MKFSPVGGAVRPTLLAAALISSACAGATAGPSVPDVSAGVAPTPSSTPTALPEPTPNPAVALAGKVRTAMEAQSSAKITIVVSGHWVYAATSAGSCEYDGKYRTCPQDYRQVLLIQQPDSAFEFTSAGKTNRVVTRGGATVLSPKPPTAMVLVEATLKDTVSVKLAEPAACRTGTCAVLTRTTSSTSNQVPEVSDVRIYVDPATNLIVQATITTTYQIGNKVQTTRLDLTDYGIPNLISS